MISQGIKPCNDQLDDACKCTLVEWLSIFNIHPLTTGTTETCSILECHQIMAGIDSIIISPRVSTDQQARSGYSKDVVQILDCERIAAQYGKALTPVQVFSGESGRTADQNSLVCHLEEASRIGRTAVMRWSLNRILRTPLGSNRLETSELSKIASYGVPIFSAMPLEATDNQLRSRMTRLIIQYKKGRGEQYAQETFVPPDSSPMILRLHSRGHDNQTIADELNSSGYLTKSGRLWNRKQVWRVLRELASNGVHDANALEMSLIRSSLLARQNTGAEGLKRRSVD